MRDATEVERESTKNYIKKISKPIKEIITMSDLKELTDNVNHPHHYEGDGTIECIDAMEEALGTNGVFNFCIGNTFKYIWRCKKKYDSPVEDLKKAQWYLNKAVSLLEKMAYPNGKGNDNV